MALCRRLICLLCSLALVSALVPLAAYGASLQAASPDVLLSRTVDVSDDYELADAVVYPAGGMAAAYDGDTLSSTQKALYDTLCAGARKHSAEINVYDLNVHIDTLKDIAALAFNTPELWWLGASYGLRYYPDGRAFSISFVYAYNAAEVQLMQPEVDDTIQTALSWVPEEATEFQRAQALHDFLVRTCRYSTDEDAAGNYPLRCHRAVGALYGVDRDPVCQGYALAYKLLLKAAGIDAVYVGSNAMNHAWNLVNLDGAWYHVDVTWDDLLPDRGFDSASLSYRYFLKSDASFRNLDHPSWQTGITSSASDYTLPANLSAYKGAAPEVPDCSTAGHARSRTMTQTLKHATCTAGGSSITWVQCLRCRQVLSRSTAAIPALGHAFGDYAYNNDAKPGVDGTKTSRCTRCGTSRTVTAAGTALKGIAKVRLSAASYTYNGKARKPSVTVYDNKGAKLRNGTHYTVSYSSGRKYPGTYKVTVRGKGSYAKSRTFTASFKIKAPTLAKPKVTKATGARKALTLRWKKTGGYTAGYQVQLARDAKFTKGMKKLTVSKAKTTAATVKSLKAKTRYQVRIRSYARIGGKTYYSGWSAVKAARTK